MIARKTWQSPMPCKPTLHSHVPSFATSVVAMAQKYDSINAV
jgi:hypothetical protein